MYSVYSKTDLFINTKQYFLTRLEKLNRAWISSLSAQLNVISSVVDFNCWFHMTIITSTETFPHLLLPFQNLSVIEPHSYQDWL